ncbi:MAG: TolC family protein [Oligoflexia bacterium]|nr:TolC family protein [Oligoflexia bacterium]
MCSYRFCFILILALAPLAPGAGTRALAQTNRLAFPEIWLATRSGSPAIASADAAREAAEIAQHRAARHWLPRLYAGGRTLSTNDAGMALISKLAERNVTGMDLAPLPLNEPGPQTHSRLSLGAELPLFEGGSRVALRAAAAKNAEATKLERALAERLEYARAATAHGSLILLEEQREALALLKRLTEGTLERYELGGRANPLGHSGYLGLRSLKLRLEGELSMNQAKHQAAHALLRTLAPLPGSWSPAESRLQEHLSTAIDPYLGETPESLRVRSQTLLAEGLESLAGAERARFLPRIALFGEGTTSFGQGARATSYQAGIEIQWSLLNFADHGALGEARARARGQERLAAATRATEAADRAALLESGRALAAQLKLARESLQLLEQQSEIARKLFQNGQINALQLTEVFARRVDLITAKTQMEEGLLQAKTRLLTLSTGALPALANEVSR